MSDQAIWVAVDWDGPEHSRPWVTIPRSRTDDMGVAVDRVLFVSQTVRDDMRLVESGVGEEAQSALERCKALFEESLGKDAEKLTGPLLVLHDPGVTEHLEKLSGRKVDALLFRRHSRAMRTTNAVN